MIDQLSIKAPIGPPQPHHQTCLSTVSYSRFLLSKTKPTTTFVNSPITSKQIEVLYWVEDVGGTPTAFVQVNIPLASATVGHNYAHAGLDSVLYEVKCAALLAKITLTVLGFTPDEVARFMKAPLPQLLELTWHTETASERARLSLQKRTKDHFNAQRRLSSRHDVAVTKVYYAEDNEKPGLLVSLKSGDFFRQYGKAAHVSSRTRRDRAKSRMSAEASQYRGLILGAIEHDARNEILAGADTLHELGLGNPNSWTPDSLKLLIDHIWKKMGLAPDQPDADAKLSPEAADTWRRYQTDEDMRKVLPGPTFSRHRASINKATGDDIALRRKARAVRPRRLGYQLCYDRRWEPKGNLRKAVLCEETAPAIIEELERGYAFLQDGEIPEFEDAEVLGLWLRKWRAYAQREGGRRPELKQAPSTTNIQPERCRSNSIGDAPLQHPVPEDQVISYRGELMVI